MQRTKSESASENTVATGRWLESTLGILYVVNDTVQFSDDWDHWRNGFCRLLEISEAKARNFVEAMVDVAVERHGKHLASLDDTQRIACLTEASNRVLYGRARPTNGAIKAAWNENSIWSSPADTIFAYSVSGDSSRIVVGNKKDEFAWLIETATETTVAADSIKYDDAYFSAAGSAHYGMKHYVAQTDWRLEKARRLVRTVIENLGERKNHWLAEPAKTQVLDIGSGMGYFRKAFDEFGFDQYGIDLSPEISAKAKEHFGFDTWLGDLAQLAEFSNARQFQIISLWDVIEHLQSPLETMQELKKHLAPDGVVVIRTPNLSAIEAEILGDFYYSFKFDHRSYFSVRSLTSLMDQAGYKQIYVETASHIFKGALSIQSIYQSGKDLKGADIVAIYEMEQGK